MTKYSDLLADWLVELGYTHCFFLSGGNVMHLVESCSRRFTCIPVVHEVAAGIAVEYFNEISDGARAFALVTAGPGFTNIVTALAGAFLESRELLVLGGQVKVADLSRGQVRQRGVQEIDGVTIAQSISVRSSLVDQPLDQQTFNEWVQSGSTGRKGPVFLELPLDIQGAQVDEVALRSQLSWSPPAETQLPILQQHLDTLQDLLKKAQRPVILLGAGIQRAALQRSMPGLEDLGVPLMTSWNGFDRIAEDHALSFGRPDTWGQRSSNILLQQADLVLALGARLSLQQTGFNWQKFVPVGKVVQVEIDQRELQKGHPRVDLPIHGDANFVLEKVAAMQSGDYTVWRAFCRSVRDLLPLSDPANTTAEGFVSPYAFNEILSGMCTGNDNVIPCSSGGANTVAMQSWRVKAGQRGFNSKSLASMGYGLSGAIGAALAWPDRRTILMEGDGGFSQNLQELGTVRAQKLNLKIFINDDHGYASIRMSQINYFNGHYVGCDIETGLGLPDWHKLFPAYSIPVMTLVPGFENDAEFLERFNAPGPAAFLVNIDPKQTYFPKITSRVTESGSMESNPLHFMAPDLPAEVAARVFRYIDGDTQAKVTK